MHTISELLPPARAKNMPTDGRAAVTAGMSIDVAPASRGPHVMTRDVLIDELSPSNGERDEAAGYANCIVSSSPPSSSASSSSFLSSLFPASVPASCSGMGGPAIDGKMTSSEVAPASRGPHAMVREAFEEAFKEEVGPSKRVSFELAGYVNSKALTKWI